MNQHQIAAPDTEQLTPGMAYPACVLVCAICGQSSVFFDTLIDHEIIRRDWVQLPFADDAQWAHVICPATIDLPTEVEVELDREWARDGRVETEEYRQTVIRIRQANRDAGIDIQGVPKTRHYVGEYNPWRDHPDDPGMCFCARFGFHSRPGGW